MWWWFFRQTTLVNVIHVWQDSLVTSVRVSRNLQSNSKATIFSIDVTKLLIISYSLPLWLYRHNKWSLWQIQWKMYLLWWTLWRPMPIWLVNNFKLFPKILLIKIPIKTQYKVKSHNVSNYPQNWQNLNIFTIKKLPWYLISA